MWTHWPTCRAWPLEHRVSTHTLRNTNMFFIILLKRNMSGMHCIAQGTIHTLGGKTAQLLLEGLVLNSAWEIRIIEGRVREKASASWRLRTSGLAAHLLKRRGRTLDHRNVGRVYGLKRRSRRMSSRARLGWLRFLKLHWVDLIKIAIDSWMVSLLCGVGRVYELIEDLHIESIKWTVLAWVRCAHFTGSVCFASIFLHLFIRGVFNLRDCFLALRRLEFVILHIALWGSPSSRSSLVLFDRHLLLGVVFLIILEIFRLLSLRQIFFSFFGFNRRSNNLRH